MAKKEPLVSVNITTYNRANLLKRCVDSVLMQNYSNMEIIIVDDCSQDNTKEMVEEYQLRDISITYIKHEKNSGLAVARNTALKNSNGVYIAFMDDDDEWIDSEKLRKQVKIFEHDKSGRLALVCSGVNLINKKNEIKTKIIQHPDDIKGKIMRGNGFIYSPTVMTRRSVAKKVGGFDEKLGRGIDSEYYRTCIMKNGYNVFFMKDITANIHEYGADRITIVVDNKDLVKIIWANLYLIYKYLPYIFSEPKSFYTRFKQVFFAMRAIYKNKV